MRFWSQVLKIFIFVIGLWTAIRYSCISYTDGSLPICKYTSVKLYVDSVSARYPYFGEVRDQVFEKYENVSPIVGEMTSSVVSKTVSTFESNVIPFMRNLGESGVRISQDVVSISIDYVLNEVWPRSVHWSKVMYGKGKEIIDQMENVMRVYVKPKMKEVYYKILLRYPILESYVTTMGLKYQLSKIYVFKYYNIARLNIIMFNKSYGYGRLQEFIYVQKFEQFVYDNIIFVWTYIKDIVVCKWEVFLGHVESNHFLNDSMEIKDELEDYVETSTILVTITQTDPNIQLKPTDLNEEIEVSIDDFVKDEFSSWKATIETKANQTLAEFEREIEEYALEKLDSVKPIFQELMRTASNTSQKNFQIITRATMDINCTEKLDPETNTTIWFDKQGTQINRYMTRELMRTFFSAAHTEFDAISMEIRNMLKGLAEDVNEHVEFLRNEHVELYEEWADIMITEWSKRLAFLDVIVHDENKESLNEEQRKNWKQYMKLKKQLIDTRDTLLNHPIKLQTLQKFVNSVQHSLKILSRENGEHLYILRSKANLEFQAREALERNQQQKLKLENTTSNQIPNENSTSIINQLNQSNNISESLPSSNNLHQEENITSTITKIVTKTSTQMNNTEQL